jgi:isopentenyl-diphosphate Delta-isomerase
MADDQRWGASSGAGAQALRTASRKVAHIDVCLRQPVQFESRTTGFELFDVPYCALPESALDDVRLETPFLGKTLRAPVLIGAMTGGPEHSSQINANLATAARELGVGMMLGSQRIMLEDPGFTASFAVRRIAPQTLVIGNLGVAQISRGYGAAEIVRAIEAVEADALALHTNPLQEAMQADGDTDFRNIVPKLRDIVPAVPYPLMLKEVGHGLSAEVARRVGDIGFAALDVAGAGGTSWARVEQLVRYGEIRHPDLAEWGIPTASALRAVKAAVPHIPLVASGGIRTGLDAAKALALGAQVVAVALPLLKPALDSADAVVTSLEKLIWELRAAMHCAGARTVDELRSLNLLRATG